ncbi:Fe-S cluster assembly transcriptional regulator IscR [Pseudohongiella nitratireducens]|uniref:Fe-S cluster assembly transcriptional regulator IscR n=2 Tax=Pseudohongiella nitratireducens TaxID=1768907 RepID=A0A917GS93_9GAMM|nr:Fe-S cluster assembly transcriptional regulator IscR [Pseudohongiella nitratireducens]
MLDLAIHAGTEPVTLSDISLRQDISLSYLEQLFGRLRRRQLVVSIRGPGGGYQLAHETGDIAIVDIINAVDESVDATRCQGQGNCQQGETCLTHHLWEDLSQQIHEFLRGISLADLMARHDIRQIADDQDERRELIVRDLSLSS